VLRSGCSASSGGGTPALAAHDLADRRRVDPVLAPKGGLRGLSSGVPFADCKDLLGLELRLTASLAAGLATLRHHVGHVLLVGAEEEMGLRVDAGGRVALVADEQAVGDGAVNQLPGEAGGVLRLPGYVEPTVSLVIERPSP
jgi:hypothetical protein